MQAEAVDIGAQRLSRRRLVRYVARRAGKYRAEPLRLPALAAALTIGTGTAFGESMSWGAAPLLAYGIGHGMLLLVAGALPGSAQALRVRAGRFERWLPGRRIFALVVAAGLWWIGEGPGALTWR